MSGTGAGFLREEIDRVPLRRRQRRTFLAKSGMRSRTSGQDCARKMCAPASRAFSARDRERSPPCALQLAESKRGAAGPPPTISTSTSSDSRSIKSNHDGHEVPEGHEKSY